MKLIRYAFRLIVAIILSLGTIISFSYTNKFLSGYKEYIFYIIPSSSMFVVIGIMAIAIFIFVNRKILSKGTKILVSILCLLGLFYSYTTYRVITEENIIIHNVLNFKGKFYSYSDTEEINTGIFSKRRDVNLYYQLKLKDGTKVEVLDASIDSKEDIEEALYDLDRKLVKSGVKKNIELKNLQKFIDKNYDKNYVKDVMKILEQNES
ncbi:hypothetical protein KQI86_09525 [Clostridium sp. MSJ-11]|uniref:Uncharacterized protein n=1 Tax=Clostridium mobile TaxID=2841512 RepID=A0ABS6EJE1_9CLOT|nr:hypothetical protein [Clostridium mobile]MBU5484570.1 hypothetical protein [Clostridium mobile]